MLLKKQKEWRVEWREGDWVIYFPPENPFSYEFLQREKIAIEILEELEPRSKCIPQSVFEKLRKLNEEWKNRSKEELNNASNM